MTRIMVIGNAGGGKSTLSRTLSSRLDLPWCSIDRIQWRPGWIMAKEADYEAEHAKYLAKDRWVIDGLGSWASITRRLEAADTVVLVDYPLWRHYWWATKRQIKAFVIGRPDGPEGCPLPKVTLRLYRMMWRVHHEIRPQLLHAVERERSRKRVVHIRSPADLRAFMREPA